MKTPVIIITGIGILAAVSAAMLIHAATTPAIRDSYFTPDKDKLRQVPAGLVVVRPSTFSPSYNDAIRHVYDNDELSRTVGHNVSLRDMIAEAYDCSPAQVKLPAGAPAGGFDFLVTAGDTSHQLRAAIRKQVGYKAHHETNSTDIYVLTVADPQLPGMTVSAPDEESDTTFSDGKLHFKHQPLGVVLKGLEAGLGEPVQDHTGLTNNYDFSVVWNVDIQKRMQTGAWDVDGVKNFLAGCGLRLTPDTASMDMLIVEKTR
jgi:uncharacterized protein (TIGR03435 family)